MVSVRASLKRNSIKVGWFTFHGRFPFSLEITYLDKKENGFRPCLVEMYKFLKNAKEKTGTNKSDHDFSSACVIFLVSYWLENICRLHFY